jgi:uncharacterized protein YjbI with pentapeptide repeats
MANEEHLQIIRQGVAAWNKWRQKNPELIPDLREANLKGASLSEANLSEANLCKANLLKANLKQANLREANLRETNFEQADLSGANLEQANLLKAKLSLAYLEHANLRKAYLSEAELVGAHLDETDLTHAFLHEANLCKAHLTDAKLIGTNFCRAQLCDAHLTRADLHRANFDRADLTGANLNDANLERTILVQTKVSKATFTRCRVYGASAWDLDLTNVKDQSNLRITRDDEPGKITVDNLQVAQFIYLLLNNKEIRDVIDTIGRKGVLLLGRFTEGRIAVLERLREELRKRDFVPMVFNFDKPEVKDFTETVRILANLSHFVIADITNPKSTPLELQATVPEYMIPFVPIIEKGEEPFAMLRDLWIKHREWVFEPIRYPSVDRLIEVLDTDIVRPAQAKFADLLARKAEEMRVKDI